ncbi:hypothetical protein AMECASPLE_003693 [Ameca splendens]|uniref:Uncharacterized protein n=1 Tax=Ameca splendens TaxID=208324 RepID=A0ABV0XMR3_9TELE
MVRCVVGVTEGYKVGVGLVMSYFEFAMTLENLWRVVLYTLKSDKDQIICVLKPQNWQRVNLLFTMTAFKNECEKGSCGLNTIKHFRPKHHTRTNSIFSS